MNGWMASIHMDDLKLYKTSSALIFLKNEFIALGVETKSDGVHLGDIEVI